MRIPKVQGIIFGIAGLAAACAPASIAVADEGAAIGARADLLVVVGAEGTPEYGAQFAEWVARWEAAAARGNACCTVIGRDVVSADPGAAQPTDRERLRAALVSLASGRDAPLWIVFIGHGTADRRAAKFNLRGPDLSAAELAEWLEPIERPLAVVNCASASGPFLDALARPERVIVTATKSGSETDFARFGDFLSRALEAPEADIDRDGQTSLLEAFLFASRRTAEFYARENRLAMEHALLDDNGDGRGVRAEDFRGVRSVGQAGGDGSLPDGLVAHQWHLVPSEAEARLSERARQRRDELERALFRLRERKGEIEEGEYLRQLEALALDLARLYAESGR